jgi:pilus assembly protein CpaF
VPPSERAEFLDSTLAEMLGWGVLTPLMDDPSITEIMCNGPHEVWVERAGKIETTDVRFPTESSYRQVIDRMLATAGRRVDEVSR